MDVDTILQQTPEKTALIDSADLVLGILAGIDRDGLLTLCDGLRGLPGSPRIVVLQNVVIGDANSSLSLLPWSAVTPDPGASSIQSISTAYELLFAATEKLGARACCLIASQLENSTPDWICKLLNPLLGSEFDLVLPYFESHKLQGLLNSSIVYPLTRCLYGKRIHNPLGPDVGISQRLAQKLLGTNRNGGLNQTHPLASLTPGAVCDNMQICQVHAGARSYPPMDWTNTSSLIAQVLGPVFMEMERRAACWQRTRGSVAVPTFGNRISLPQETADLDLNRMVETFHLGVRDLQEIWSLVLPPATLFELRKLSRLAPERIYMPDELWARIVYDFALAHRLRTINRDHLLRSMTPLYLAWVVSYVREFEMAGTTTVDQRIERLALAYEGAKPYFISRWRWPDRFNP